MVGDGCDERDEPISQEDRHRHHEVGQVRPAVEGIIENVDVAIPHRVGRELGDEPRHRRDDHAEVDRRRGRLGDLLPTCVEDGSRRVERLFHDRGVGALEDGDLHLVGDRVELVANDLEGNGVDGRVNQFRSSADAVTIKLPLLSTVARWPG